MSERDFNELLNSISTGALPPEQLAALRRALTEKLLERPRPKAKVAFRMAAKSKKPGEIKPLTAYEFMSAAGVIGCIKGKPGSPTDLATNPKHMEGFGSD